MVHFGMEVNNIFQERIEYMHKKTFLSVVICLLILFVMSACNSSDIIKIDKTTVNSSNNTKSTESTNSLASEITSFTDIGGGSISTRKYRVNYYDVPYQFVLLVGEDAFWEWDEKYNNENPDETNVMVMRKFIEYFNISREDFDKANLEWTKTIFYKMGGKPVMNPKDFANQETDESYNADIIYTFDNEKINEYYLSGFYPYVFESDYDEAVADGIYETRTTDWIDIEQMEADIIAKYGETEIVTESTTAEQTQTTTVEQPETTVG